MTNPVISVEHLTKQYDLGVIGTGTLSRDLNRWWARVRKQPDPYTRIGQKDAFERIGESILALDDVSFQVQHGEVLGIIGRNGAGKSTLLKILSRVTAPSSGVVKVKGRIGSLLEVGTGFHPELTGRENVYLNGAILGMKKTEVTRKFDEIVNFAGVEKFIDTPVKRYSSGMYVRLAFAVAAHLESEILIVDEVLAVGDAEFQKKCLGKMGDVASNEGRTVLFVSHNMGAIRNICKNGILLWNGRISSKGQITSVIDNYLSGLLVEKDSSLLNRQDRKGLGRIKFVDIFLQKIRSTEVVFGDNLIIVFKLSKIQMDTIISFTIYNSAGIAISTFRSSKQIFTNSSLTEFTSTMECRIENIYLSPGQYRINAAVFNNEVLEDHIEGATFFTVLEGTYNNQPVYSVSGFGSIYMPNSWKLSDEDEE